MENVLSKARDLKRRKLSFLPQTGLFDSIVVDATSAGAEEGGAGSSSIIPTKGSGEEGQVVGVRSQGILVRTTADRMKIMYADV